MYGLILADIPGLIEGASEGRGLGHKFLRHIERTKTLIHCISAEEADPVATYNIVRKELELYNPDIIKKPEVVVLTKVDMIAEEERAEKMKSLEKVTKVVKAVSVIDEGLLKEFTDYITGELRKEVQ